MLRSYVGKNIKQWDLILSQIKFAYNRYMHHSIGKSSFEIVNGANLAGPLDFFSHSTTKQFSRDADKRVK